MASVRLGPIVDRSRKLKGADQYIAFAAYGMRRLGAEAARFDTIRSGCGKRPLGQRVDGRAGIAQCTEYAARTLDDDRQIGFHLAGDKALLDAGQAEYQQ